VLIDETETRFYVADSTAPDGGNGLFTGQAMRKGDRFEVIGVLVRRDSLSDKCTHFCDHHKFRVGEDLLLIPMGIGGMANHSLAPNLRKVFEGERVFLEITEDVPADTEVFFTYTEYAQEAFGLLPT
jgi:hypothetical protein